VDAITQTAAPNNELSNPPFIRSGHLAAPGFSEHRIYWEEYGSLTGEPVIVMHAGRVQEATARPPAFSIRSDTASCFSTSAVAARARPVRAMMTQHRIKYFITTAGHSSLEPDSDTRLRTIMNELPPMTSPETASLR
jgi:hypothetical protein